MLLKHRPLGPRPMVLELGCAAGAITAELAHRLPADGRLVALDASSALLSRARDRLGEEHCGRRVFFRSHPTEHKLPFAEETFDLVLANLSVMRLQAPEAAIADCARVLKRGGQLILAAPLRGTWEEFLDIFAEALTRLRREDALAALAGYVEQDLPEAETVARRLEAAGLEVDVQLDHWELVFRSAREFFYAPVIELGPLPRWKAVAGRGEAMQSAFLAVKESIDVYFAGRAFSVTVVGGSFDTRKP